MKGQPSRKSVKYLQLHCRGKFECFTMVLWSGRVAHKVTFLCDQRFSRVGPYCAAVVRLSGGWALSSTHGPFPSFPRSVFSCVLVWQLHCSFILGVHLCFALCHHLLKELSETCGYKTPSYEYNCRVVNNVCINYPVRVDVQLHWCELQKDQLCQTENTFSPTGGLETLPHCQTFTSSHLCYLGKEWGANCKFLLFS